MGYLIAFIFLLYVSRSPALALLGLILGLAL
jgi:hypothetical protein